MLTRSGPVAAGPERRSALGWPIVDMSSSGTTTSTSSCLRSPASTIVTGLGPWAVAPPRKRAISSSGRWVADSPIRCGGVSVIASRRSSESARCAPRLVAATAWISSTITVSTPRRVSRAEEVSIRYRDSGVVIRMSGGWRRSSRRSAAGVSPVRMPTVGSRKPIPSRSAASRIPVSGARRFFSTSTASARSGETYRTRQRRSGAGSGSVTRRSIADRNAARVLPEPVGARISVWRPWAIAGQPSACAAVGAAKAPANHSRTAGENRSSVIGPAYVHRGHARGHR